jgi:hypothetical protein
MHQPFYTNTHLTEDYVGPGKKGKGKDIPVPGCGGP